MASSRVFVAEGGYGYCSETVPDLIVDAPGDLDPVDLLETRGIRGWAIDLDGTLVPPLEEHKFELTDEDREFLEVLLVHPMLYAAVTTNRRSSMPIHPSLEDEHLLRRFPIFFGDDFQKPDKRFFDPVFADFEPRGIKPTEMVMVGDSLYHDIRGAQGVGMLAVQVGCLDPNGFFTGLTDEVNHT